MNTQRSKILLEKVNALFKSMNADENNITSIERDLMLSYLRQLYDSILESNNSTLAPQTSTFAATSYPNDYRSSKETIEKSSYKPPRIIEIPESLKEDVEEDFHEIKKKEKIKQQEREIPTPPRIITPPKLDPTPEPTYTPQVTYKPPVVESAPIPPVAPTPKPPVPQPQPVTTATTPITNIADSSGQHEELFEFKAAKELSEKLSERPIRDLTKAFSLNDKLLYANELFGKELVIFNEEVRIIDGLNNFAEAKTYLSQLADKYNWSSKSKVSMAKDFVFLVKRRFS